MEAPAHSRQSLPSELNHISQAIERSRSLLDLENDWDEAGSPPIVESTWRRATEFLARHALGVFESDKQIIDAPDMTPGPEGSIDLHWDYPAYEILVNIPADPAAMAGFYGDDRGSISIKGKLDPSHFSEGLHHWLIKSNPAHGPSSQSPITAIS